VFPAGEFGARAEAGELTPVPPGLRAADHPFQWTGVLPPYRERLIEWGGQARAVPLAGDGYVVAYRADRLADPGFAAAHKARLGRDPAPPATWEDFADLAAALAAHAGKPSLPAMTPGEAADLFFRVAACYDRQALADADASRPGRGLAAVSFQHDAATGDHRLRTAGFAAAADLLGRLAAGKCLPPPPAGPSDPAAALASGDAALAVLSLAQLSRLPRENGAVPARVGVAPLPGARGFVDPADGKLKPAGVPNYVPYFSGGWVGAVRTGCPHPDAGFDLLADLGGPTRSLEAVATPGLGAGPLRAAHLERDRLSAWLGYGFDPDRTKGLQEAMRQYVRQEVKNPGCGLRGPDRAELSAAAAEEVGRVAAGAASPADGLMRLAEAWDRIDAKAPKEARVRWRKAAAGVN
jgi:ABC-type glycerol-3-phosphate transport system substrate-binding protein